MNLKATHSKVIAVSYVFPCAMQYDLHTHVQQLVEKARDHNTKVYMLDIFASTSVYSKTADATLTMQLQITNAVIPVTHSGIMFPTTHYTALG